MRSNRPLRQRQICADESARSANAQYRVHCGNRGRLEATAAHASFLAVKSYGPTNPANTALENDPGVIGALFLDQIQPSTPLAERILTGLCGKVQFLAKASGNAGCIEFANAATYLDGLVFGRRLLVTVLPQGRCWSAPLPRKSGRRQPSGTCLELERPPEPLLSVRYGSLRLALDLFNVTNENNSIQQSDISGPFSTSACRL